MKLKAFIVLSLLTASTAFAQFFPGRVDVVVLPGRIAAQVVNPFFQPIVCSGQVFGQIASGQVFNTFFYEQVLPIGAYRYAYVTTTPFLPFVGGWANINCRYLGWY